ncbi:MAG: ATP-binding cassette domain-containing protein [Acidimicrobiia bacterium]
MATETTMVCEGIRRAYHTDGEVVWALWDVDARAEAGQITVLAGPSGSGKSTLLRVMAGIDLPDSGRVEVAGNELTAMSSGARRRYRSRHMGYLFQDPAANLLSYLTVREHLQMAGKIRGGTPNKDLLAHLEIEELADEHPVRLSAGQQQRAALAAAMVGDPDLILADEPTAELDTASAHLAVAALARLRDLGATLVVTSHDPEVVQVADRLIHLEHGAVKE